MKDTRNWTLNHMRRQNKVKVERLEEVPHGVLNDEMDEERGKKEVDLLARQL